MIKRILALLIALLLISVDNPLQPSMAWDRSTAWTPWLYKIGPLSIADIVIILVALYSFLNIAASKEKEALPSPYLKLGTLSCVYLAIGAFYNLVVYEFWKTFLYDFKIVLLLFVPFLFLSTCKDDAWIKRLLAPDRLIAYYALSAVVDFTITNVFGSSEYPSFFGVPSIPNAFPMQLLIVGFVMSATLKYRTLFLVLLCFEVISSLNKLSFGVLFYLVDAAVILLALRVNVKGLGRALSVSFAVLLLNAISVFLISNPLNFDLLSLKSDGSLTRQIQFENVLTSFWEDIPLLIGKGLGATWHVYTPVPSEDIYSVGTAVGATSEEAMASDVQFIFNWGPPSLLYKWGIFGSIALCFAIGGYYQVIRDKIRLLGDKGLSEDVNRYLVGLLLISTLFIVANFTYIGQQRFSLLTSIMAFWAYYRVLEWEERLGTPSIEDEAIDGRSAA